MSTPEPSIAFPSLTPIHSGPKLENSLAYMGSLVSFLAENPQTGGRFSLMWGIARRGNEPPPHLHAREHEIYFMLEGEVEFFCEGEEKSFVARAGEMMFLPQGKAHATYFRSEQFRAIAIAIAAGSEPTTLDTYFQQMAIGPATKLDVPDDASTYREMGAGDIQKAVEIAASHGITFLSPEETASRLPIYPGFGANPHKSDLP